MSIQTQRSHKKLNRLFAGRPKLSDEEFFSTYFSSYEIRKDIPARVRNLLSEHLGLDLSQISSTDSFQEELVVLWDFDSMLEFELPIAIDNEFDFELTDDEILQITNIHDIVIIVDKKLSNLTTKKLRNESS